MQRYGWSGRPADGGPSYVVLESPPALITERLPAAWYWRRSGLVSARIWTHTLVSSTDMPSHLIGRENALRRARFLIADLGVVVIAGAAGVGVTAISDLLASEWRSQGGRVIELRGTHGLQRVPFGALAGAVSLAGDDLEIGNISRAVRSVTDGDGAVLTLVDDAHLLDQETAGVIGGVAQSSAGRLVISVTTGEVLSADITAIWTRWAECRIDLPPLTRGEVGEMVAAQLGRGLDESMLDEIFSITLGYPLYVRAVVTEILERDGSDGGDTPIAATIFSGTSDRLTSLMERRLARLSREERRLLDTLAFVESMPAALVSGLAGASTLSRLESSGLVRVNLEHVEVAHPLLRSVVASTLTLEGQRACAKHLLGAVTDDVDPSAVSAFVRRSLSVGVVPNPDLLNVAAHLALAWRDFSGAARIAAHAPGDQRLIVARAKALRFLGEVLDEVPVELDESALADFVSTKALAMAYGERRFTDAIAMVQEAIASLSESTHRNRLATELMILSGLSGDLDALLSAGRTIDDEADPDTRLLAVAVSQLAEGLTLSTSSADDTYARGREIIESAGMESLLTEQLEMSRVLVDLAEGRFSCARDRLAGSVRQAAPGAWSMVESLMADAWCSANEALHLAESAVAELEIYDPIGNLTQARFVAEMRRAQARHEESPPERNEVSVEPVVAEIDRMMNQRARAWYAWSVGDPTAGKRLVEVGRDATSVGHRFWGLSCFIDAVRLGCGTDVAADIEQLAITRGAGLAWMAGRYARAETREDLWECARMWLESGASTFAIEAAIRAADPDDPNDRTQVQLLAARGASPLVVDTTTIGRALPKRQEEIVLAVMGGSSSKQVAESLFIATRTVENHLHRVYQTLGIVDGRRGLSDRFGWLLAE